MRIRLIDVDGHNFPNLPLMKISAYHKSLGDEVEWYDPLLDWITVPDIVYMSKVFSYTSDYEHPINGKKIIKGGTGYYFPSGGEPLPKEIEDSFPDYSIYPQFADTAYGFLTRGCPRGCDFCIVAEKEGKKSRKVADLSSFWNGQKNVVLLDPNLFACKEWKELSQQLIDSKAWIDFSQGCDIRLMTPEKINVLQQMKIKQIHFAWDRYEEKDIIVPKFQQFKEATGWDYRKMTVYVLCGFDTSFEQDLERIYILRDGSLGAMLSDYSVTSPAPGENLWKTVTRTSDEIHTRFQAVDSARKARMGEQITQYGIAIAEVNGYFYVCEVFL